MLSNCYGYNGHLAGTADKRRSLRKYFDNLGHVVQGESLDFVLFILYNSKTGAQCINWLVGAEIFG